MLIGFDYDDWKNKVQPEYVRQETLNYDRKPALKAVYLEPRKSKDPGLDDEEADSELNSS